MKKKNNGITLIALVITIIVLLILAGVALSLVAGNEGILTKAETAVTETNIAEAKEQAELMAAELSADYYKKRYVDRDANVANQTVAEYIKAQVGAEKQSSNGDYVVKVDDSSKLTVSDKTGAVIAEGTLEESGKIVWSKSLSGGAGSGGTTPTIPEGLEVGDTVTYSPSGTYTWAAEYASSDLAVDGSADVALSSATGQDFNITSWKVFSIDESTGEVELVPSAATTGTVRLQGAQGYNNAVKLLNDACSDLYGDSNKGITARSINREDIENIINSGETNFVEYYEMTYPPENYSWLDENYQAVNAFTTDKNYPTIYEQEDLSTITYYGDTEETKVAVGAGLGRSEQTSLIERNATGAVSGDVSKAGKITTEASIRPYGTFCYLDDKTFTNLLGDYASLVLPSGTSTNYWLASRCVCTFSDYCDFLVACVLSGDLVAGYSGYGYDREFVCSRNLFPVVSLSASLVSGNDADGWKVE